MIKYKFTRYFENEVLRKRPYIKRELRIEIIENPIRLKNKKKIDGDFGGLLKNLKIGCLG